MKGDPFKCDESVKLPWLYFQPSTEEVPDLQREVSPIDLTHTRQVLHLAPLRHSNKRKKKEEKEKEEKETEVLLFDLLFSSSSSCHEPFVE